jgi:SSS family solute:Na+ symporter
MPTPVVAALLAGLAVGGAILTAPLPDVFTLQDGMAVTAVVFVAITLIGGPGALAHALPAGHPGFSLGGVGGGIVLAWFIVMVTMTHSTQSVIQVGFAARDARTAGRGYLWGALLIAPIGFLSAVLGLAAAALHPGIVTAQALPRVVLELNPLTATMVVLAIWMSGPKAWHLGLPHPVCATWLASLAMFGLVAAIDRRRIRG